MSGGSGRRSATNDKSKTTLADEIRNALARAKPASSYKYTDRIDRIRARRRNLIDVVLDVVFLSSEMHLFNTYLDDGGVEVGEDPLTKVMTEFSAARRDLKNDYALLSEGFDAETLLIPVNQGNGRKRLLSAERKVLLTAIAALDLWKNGDDNRFETQKEALSFFAKKIGRSEGSLTTSFKLFRQEWNANKAKRNPAPRVVEKPRKAPCRFREDDFRYVNSLQESARRTAGEGSSPFVMLGAIASGIGEGTVKNQTRRSKGNKRG